MSPRQRAIGWPQGQSTISSPPRAGCTRRRPNSAGPPRPRRQRQEMTMTTTTQQGNQRAKATSLDHARQLAEKLMSERGEAGGAQVSRQLHDALRALDATDRHGFQLYLASS